MKINVIITAGGQSQRYGAKNKLFERCGNSCVLVEAIKPFLSIQNTTRIIVGIETSYADELTRELDNAGLSEDRRIIFGVGGKTRTQTVKNAISALDDDADIILIHDGARPYVKSQTIIDVIQKTQQYGVALPLLKVTDALVEIKNDVLPADRENYRRVQTPFGVSKAIFIDAYKDLQATFYDDLSAVKTVYSGEIGIVDGDEDNIKITYNGDIRKTGCNFLTGCGYDIHRLAEGNGISLLGVRVHCEYSFIAHSDGDVPIHAIMDAILSALGEKDIGHFFPVDDPLYDGADSVELLLRVLSIARTKGYVLYNMTASIIAERPMLAPYIDKMKNKMSDILNIPQERIGISATTNERVGDIGDGKAIAAYASVLLKKI